MCEPTCVINRLQAIRRDLEHLDQSPVAAMCVAALQHDLMLCIKQLEWAGEGQSWRAYQEFAPTSS